MYQLTIKFATVAELLTYLNGSTAASTGIVAVAADDNDDNEPVAVVAPGEVDASSLPWDARIHSGKKTKTAAGMWRALKGVDAATVTAIEAQLRAGNVAVAAPAVIAPPAPVAAPPAAPVVAAPPPAAPVAAPVVTAPPAAPPAAPLAPAPVAAPAAAPALDFGGLMGHISAGMLAVPPIIDQDGAFVAWLAASLGVAELGMIAADPAKIAEAYNLMVAEKRIIGLA